MSPRVQFNIISVYTYICIHTFVYTYIHIKYLHMCNICIGW